MFAAPRADDINIHFHILPRVKLRLLVIVKILYISAKSINKISLIWAVVNDKHYMEYIKHIFPTICRIMVKAEDERLKSQEVKKLRR